MTRQEIESQYKVENGIIRSPGKFEGEPVYAPYFWEALLDGMADKDDGKSAVFYITQEDKEQFPELKRRRAVRLFQDDNGFVWMS